MPIPPAVLSLLTEAFYEKLHTAAIRWSNKNNSDKDSYPDYRFTRLFNNEYTSNHIRNYCRDMARRYWRMATKP